MATLRHPYTSDRPRIEWHKHGTVYKCVLVRAAKYTHSQQYHVETPFAAIRPVYGPAALYDDRKGWVVTRNDFESVASFDTLQQAITYVESLVALETY